MTYCQTKLICVHYIIRNIYNKRKCIANSAIASPSLFYITNKPVTIVYFMINYVYGKK